MTDILKCDLCGADAGYNPYHATINGNGHTHICASCFDPQQHDVGVIWMQRDELLNILQRLEAVDFGEHWNSDAEQAAIAARALIRKFEVESGE